MERISNWIKLNRNYILLFFSLFVINFLFFSLTNDYYVNNGEKSIFKYITLVSLVLEFVFMFFISYLKNKNFKIHRIYLVFSVLFGILYMIILPIGSVPDETNHFFRSYEISEGHFLSDKNENQVGGRAFDTNMDAITINSLNDYNYKKVKDNIFVKNKRENEKYYTFANTSLYSVFSYIPQTIGIGLGRMFNAPILISAYLGRIVNYIFFVIIIYFSIKYIPFGKMVVFLISFLPMVMQEAISLAPDAMTNAVAIAMVSFVLYMRFDKKSGVMTKKKMTLFSILTIWISMLKIVYLPICLIAFLIPEEKFKNRKDKLVKIGILAFVVIVLNIIWLKISSSYLVEFQPGVDSASQVQFVLYNPYSYLKVLFNTINYNFITYFNTMLGTNLGWLNIYLSSNYLFSYFLVIFIALLLDKNIRVDSITKKIFGFIAFSVIILIFTSLYVQWTPFRNPAINGVQGRYFIPILLIILLVLKPNKIKFDLIDNEKYGVLFMAMINIYSLVTIFYNFIF